MADESFLAGLWSTIEARKTGNPAGTSYTRQLLADPARIRRKIIEEAYEVNEAHQGLLSGKDSARHLAEESADLVYHLFVLLASADLRPTDVYDILEDRHRRRSAQRSE